MMRAAIDLTGQRFGRLLVIAESTRRTGKGELYWLCRCDCGIEKEIRGPFLRAGVTRSCGCLAAELSAIRGKQRKQAPKKCKVEGCEYTVEKGGKELCGKHAQRQRRYGDVNYVMPEERRRELSREAQLKNVPSIKPTTYRKYLGKHQHRVVAEQKIGRPLKDNEVVHHIDHNRHNNAPDNLEVMDRAEHLRLHARERRKGK